MPDNVLEFDSKSYKILTGVISEKQKILLAISEEERIKRIEDCLIKGAKIDADKKNGNTALNVSVKNGYLRIIKFAMLNDGQESSERNDSESSSVKDFQSNGDNIGENYQQTSPFGGINTYAAAHGLKNSLHGDIYQLKLLMFFICRGLRLNYPFRLATEMDKAEKFDDLVFQYKDKENGGSVYRFLQAKHKQNETKKISANDLLNETDNDFSLQKYFISYRKIKKDPEFKRSTLKDFTICTNMGFDFKGLESKGIPLKKLDEPDVFLDIINVNKQPARYKFLVGCQSDLWKILKRAAEIDRLAKILVDHVIELKDITLRDDLFKRYHIALAEEVIDVNNKKFSVKFIEGENLTSKGKIFREIFYTEALEKFLRELAKNVPANAIWEEITKKPLKLSLYFGITSSTDPTLNHLEEFSDELVELINSADNDNLVTVDGVKYRKNAKAGSRERVFADDMHKLVGHVLIMVGEKIKFRSQFFQYTTLPGNLRDLRNSLKDKLGTKYNDLEKYEFEMPTHFTTIVENLLYARQKLPVDKVDDKDIEDFFDKLIFAVNQPNEIELENVITEEICADNRFDKLNANLVAASFQKEILDWFKEKGGEKGHEGKYYSNVDAQNFFDSAQREINGLMIRN